MRQHWQFGTRWGREEPPALAAFSSWTARYVAASDEARRALLPEGLRLARARRIAFLELIQTRPGEALACTVPVAVRRRLPDVIRAQLEERVSGRGDFEVLAAALVEDGVSGTGIVRGVMIGERRWAAHVFGERRTQRTSRSISMHGVALDGDLALSESPVRLLEADETLAGEVKPVDPVCSISGLASATAEGEPALQGALRVASGDRVRWVCRGGHIEALEYEVRADEGGTAGGTVAASAFQTTGSRSMLLMRVDFADLAGGSVSLTNARASLSDVAGFIRSNAFHQVEFSVQDVTPVLRLPRTGSAYASAGDANGLLRDARDAAAAAGFDPALYDFDIVAFAQIGLPWHGLGYVGAKGCWIQGEFDRGVTAHELGHNFGNWHANAWVSTNIIGLDGRHVEYGNPFDVLGLSANYPRNHHSANFKFLNGWLPNTNLHTVTASGIYRIFAHDFGGPLNLGRKYGIRIPVGLVAGGETMDYWVDFRPAYAGNSATNGTATNTGALLQWGNDFGTQSASRLLDTQPGTFGSMDDAPLAVGRTFTDAERGLSITTLAQGTTGGDRYLDIRVQLTAAQSYTLGQALDLPGAAWSTGGDQLWIGQSANTHDGTNAAASGVVEHNQQSFVETVVSGPGTLAFWWRVSSEAGYDFLSFLVDGLVQGSISGESGWQIRTNYLPAGTHALRWRYSKDRIISAGSDRAWLDQVSFTPGEIPPLITAQPMGLVTTGPADVSFSVTVVSAGPAGYQWRRDGLSLTNGGKVSGARGPTLLLTGATRAESGAYSVVVTNAIGRTDSSNAFLRVIVPLVLHPPVRLSDGRLQLWFEDPHGVPLTASDAARLQVRASSNLADWVALDASLVVTNGLIQIVDPGSASITRRFYEVIEE